MKIKRSTKDNGRVTSFSLGPLSMTLDDLGGRYGFDLTWLRKKWTFILVAIVLKKATA